MKRLITAAVLITTATTVATIAHAQPPMPTAAPGCYAVSDDAFVNIREWPNGPIMGPVPVGTQFQVLDTWYDYPSNLNWSRVQTSWLAQRGITGVVASYLIDCN